MNLKEQKEKIILFIDDEKNKGIAIDPYYCKSNLGKLESINYLNIKYMGIKSIKSNVSNEERKDHIFIKFTNMSVDLINGIKNTIIKYIENDKLNVTESILEIIKLFRKVSLKKDFENELFGDMGEAIFIYLLLKKGINVMKYLRVDDNDLYDFQKDKLFFEIKTTSTDKNEFVISHEQLMHVKDKKIIICKFKKIPGYINILNLYNMINEIEPLHNLLLLKKTKWETYRNQLISNDEPDVISNYSVILENCTIGLFKDHLLPEVSLINKNACNKIKYYINCTNSELDDINVFCNLINN